MYKQHKQILLIDDDKQKAYNYQNEHKLCYIANCKLGSHCTKSLPHTMLYYKLYMLIFMSKYSHPVKDILRITDTVMMKSLIYLYCQCYI